MRGLLVKSVIHLCRSVAQIKDKKINIVNCRDKKKYFVEFACICDLLKDATSTFSHPVFWIFEPSEIIHSYTEATKIKFDVICL